MTKENYNKPKQYDREQRYHFVRRFYIVKAMVFPVVMYGCESCTVKKAEQ